MRTAANETTTVDDGPLTRFSCADCGYGASRRGTAPARCPMCSGTVWDYDEWRPFADRAAMLDAEAPLARELR
jgi:hypothetical protein